MSRLKDAVSAPWALYLVPAVSLPPAATVDSIAPQITLPRSGDISPDLFKSSAALLPDTLLLELGRRAERQEGGGGSAVTTASYCQAQTVQRSGSHSGWEKVGMAQATPWDWSKTRRLRLQKQMYVRRVEVGWSSAIRYEWRRHGLFVRSQVLTSVDDNSSVFRGTIFVSLLLQII